jgi:uncharacterized membrane protein
VIEQKRLFFIDAIRAWAIIMMLQGHFIDGLLDPIYRNTNHNIYNIWLYFRGITAPVFFTASGLIFTYLLFKETDESYRNKRLKKGFKRAGQLLLLGYLLRLNINGLFKGEIYPSSYYVDVLHCIGIALFCIIVLYYLIGKWSYWGFALVAVLISVIVFIFEPLYINLTLDSWPVFLSHYISKAHGSVFTIIPWLGYSTFGAFLALLLLKFKSFHKFYPAAILICILGGYLLKYESSDFFIWVRNTIEWPHLEKVAAKNYLFIRLGDVLWVLAIFMGLRNAVTHPRILAIGQNTLSIYVIHSVLLYGSSYNFGLYRFFKQSLTPTEAISGSIVFVTISVSLSFLYVHSQNWRSQIFSRIFTKK